VSEPQACRLVVDLAPRSYLATDPGNEQPGTTIDSTTYTYNVCAQVPLQAIPSGCSVTSHGAAYSMNKQANKCQQLSESLRLQRLLWLVV
jgi:hypothetical protein